MNYSDKDLLVATQIAYFDITKDMLQDSDTGQLREILNENKSILTGIQDALDNAKTELERTRFEEKLKLYNEIVKEGSEYGDWVIKSVKDDNSNTGFYGCLIETSKDSAIVGFRGSEDASGDQFEKDWVNADLRLLNNTLTDQQAVASEFMEEINNTYHYNNYATSGHSLGGNLSIHATLSAPDDMQYKITQCKSYDGPGYSAEYLELYKNEITKMAKVIDHYQWSLVGALLYQVPGSNYQSILTKESVYNNYNLEALVQKHDTSFVSLDENGNVQKGEMDRFAQSMGELSRNIENCPRIVGDALISLVVNVASMSDVEKNSAVIAAATGFVYTLITCPTIVISAAIVAGGIALISAINPDFIGKVLIPAIVDGISSVIEFVDSFVKAIESAFDIIFKSLELAAEIYHDIMEGVKEIIKNFASWVNGIFNPGYRFASENPYIKLNTYKLRSYAERLDTVNIKISRLDNRLNSLYAKFSFWDWWTIFKVDLCTEYSPRLERCRNYLLDTAEDFEDVELNLLSYIENA